MCKRIMGIRWPRWRTPTSTTWLTTLDTYRMMRWIRWIIWWLGTPQQIMHTNKIHLLMKCPKLWYSPWINHFIDDIDHRRPRDDLDHGEPGTNPNVDKNREWIECGNWEYFVRKDLPLQKVDFSGLFSSHQQPRTCQVCFWLPRQC